MSNDGQLAAVLTPGQTPEYVITMALQRVFSLCAHNERAKTDALREGVVEGCARVLRDAAGMEPRLMSVHCLRQLCFRNEAACARVVNCADLLQTCVEVSCSKSEPDHLRAETCKVLTCVAFDFSQHDQIVAVLPPLVSVMLSPLHPVSLRQAVVSCINNIAYNPGSHQALLRQNVVPALVEVVESRNTQLFYFDAAIAIANLMPHHPVLSQDPQLAETMLVALDRTLQGDDFPPDSRWFYSDHKLMMGISNMCCSPTLRDRLVPTLPRLILAALQDDPTPDLVRHSLRALWRLSGG